MSSFLGMLTLLGVQGQWMLSRSLRLLAHDGTWSHDESHDADAADANDADAADAAETLLQLE